MAKNIRSITVTTIDGKIYTTHGEIERDKGLEQAHDLFRNFETLAHVRLELDNGTRAYINPKHIISAVIGNSEED